MASTSGNPLIAQGTLNRIRGAFQVVDTPSLNATAPYLGKEGISLSLDGESTLYIPTMTGAVTSPEPYMMVTVRLHLLRTQGLASQYKTQMESLSTIGRCVVTPDASTLPVYTLENCSIEGVDEMPMNGTDAGFNVRIRGYYTINNNLFNAA
jgi:hypothetical protein